MKKSLTALSLAFAAGALLAQAPQAPDALGKVTEARGVVTVSDGATVGIAQNGTPFFDGTRFVSSPSGRAELTLDNGCVIRLEPNQSLVVRGKVSCEQLMALVQNVPGAPVVAGAGTGSGLTGMRALGIAGAALLVAGAGGGGGSSGSGGGGGNIPNPPVSGQ